MHGTLEVIVVCAKLGHNMDVASKLNPFVTVTVGSQNAKTKAVHEHGLDPNWNETFTFHVNGEDSLAFNLYDSGVGADDLLGTGTISLLKLLKQRNAEEWHAITSVNNKKPLHNAQLLFIFNFKSKGSPGQ